MPEKYALHPGYVTSSTDGTRHFINAGRLAFLYQLEPNEWIRWDERNDHTWRGRQWNDYVHLYPRNDEQYGRPDA